MSSAILQGSATGTGSVTLLAPVTNSTQTLTLPDVTATVITDSAGILNIGSGQIYKDASGNVGIGTSSPATNLDILGTSGLRIKYGAGSGLLLNQVSPAGDAYLNNQANAGIVFLTNNTERARIDSSGNFLVGCTSLPGGGTTGTAFQLGASISGMPTWTNRSSTTAASDHAYFYNPNGIVGFIRTTGSATAYSTSSDYRLKENIAPMTGALAKVALLKPVTYKWKVDGSDGEGFIAHELAEVKPDCVSGDKDAVDAEGKPQYQGIDTSFLVATLTAAIQELKAIVDAQGAEIAALKGASA